MNQNTPFSYNIMLIGFMGTGKSMVSQCLTDLLAMESVELDERIVEKENRSIADIFSQQGEAYFRDLESAVLQEVQQRSGLIVSCGGGIVLREQNVALMKERGRVVLLTATPETIYERLKDTTNRPVLNGNMNVPYIAQLMAKREEKYKNAADIVVATDNKTILEIAEDLIAQLTALGNP